MIIFSKNKELIGMIEKYLAELQESLNAFKEAIRYLMENSINDHFRIMAKKVHQHESHADDIRREIEKFMFGKSLLPETREDILNIIEVLDKISNPCEDILNDFILQRTVIIPEIRTDYLELVDISCETSKLIGEAFWDCLGKCQKLDDYNTKVDDNESLGDSLEFRMIGTIFEAELDKTEKIIQRDFVKKLGSICNICETVMDKLIICGIKRHV